MWLLNWLQYSACPSGHYRKNENALDNKEFCVGILTDLSKAFDCISHDFVIAKLNAYGFDRNALKLIYDYLSDRSQKTKLGSWFSAYLDIIFGVSEGSILATLLKRDSGTGVFL